MEVVFATVEQQRISVVTLHGEATVADAIAASGLARRFADFDFDTLEAGVWGEVVARNHVLTDGDRVELYRPLALDPRDARRQLALAGRTMGKTTEG